jgi:hypothetical protein
MRGFAMHAQSAKRVAGPEAGGVQTASCTRCRLRPRRRFSFQASSLTCIAAR